jgi:hypothetical protein
MRCASFIEGELLRLNKRILFPLASIMVVLVAATGTATPSMLGLYGTAGLILYGRENGEKL